MDDDLDIEINTEKLISLIKDKPAIYDKTSSLDHKEKQNIWFTICKELVGGWEERPQLERTQIGIKVYSRWKNLRTCFRREYNLQKEEVKALKHGYPFTQKKRKKYEFYDQLLFLLPTMALKKSASKINFPEGAAPEEREMTSRATSPIVFEDSSVTFTPLQSTIASIKIPGTNVPLIKICRVTSGQAGQPKAPGQTPQRIPTGTAAQRAAPRPPVDEDRHFLLSILPALQRMTHSQKLKAKMKFLQAISDAEVETRQALQRYPCFAHNIPEQELPELVPGGASPFVAQTDHTYYLVRERSSKRARMMPESTGTVPQPKAKRDNLQENAQVPNLQENVGVANLQETADSSNLQEIAEDAKLYESIEIDNLQQNVEIENSQENAEVRNSQENAEVRNSQENAEIGNIQTTFENVKVINSQETVDIVNIQETAEVDNLQENVASGSEPMDIAVDNDALKEG